MVFILHNTTFEVTASHKVVTFNMAVFSFLVSQTLLISGCTKRGNPKLRDSLVPRPNRAY